MRKLFIIFSLALIALSARACQGEVPFPNECYLNMYSSIGDLSYLKTDVYSLKSLLQPEETIAPDIAESGHIQCYDISIDGTTWVPMQSLDANSSGSWESKPSIMLFNYGRIRKGNFYYFYNLGTVSRRSYQFSLGNFIAGNIGAFIPKGYLDGTGDGKGSISYKGISFSFDYREEAGKRFLFLTPTSSQYKAPEPVPGIENPGEPPVIVPPPEDFNPDEWFPPDWDLILKPAIAKDSPLPTMVYRFSEAAVTEAKLQVKDDSGSWITVKTIENPQDLPESGYLFGPAPLKDYSGLNITVDAKEITTRVWWTDGVTESFDESADTPSGGIEKQYIVVPGQAPKF